MLCTAIVNRDAVTFDVDRPIDVSIPITEDNPTDAFGLPPATFVPFRAGSFVGSVEEGGPVRCDVVTLAPHGNGTHTECIGHIAGREYSLLDCLHQTLCIGELITVDVDANTNCITLSELERVWSHQWQYTGDQALIIRTMPNDASKRNRKWSGNNPPFISTDAMQFIVKRGIQHLLVDLPSVDPEQDGGKLAAHHIFWQWPQNPRTKCTITELIYVPTEVTDGLYMVNLNAAAFDGDAAPSRPMIYQAVGQ